MSNPVVTVTVVVEQGGDRVERTLRMEHTTPGVHVGTTIDKALRDVAYKITDPAKAMTAAQR